MAPGSVYVADRGNNRVLKLAAGSNTPTVLPFTGLNNPDGVAVDTAGNVYVTDTDNNRVVKLEAGSTSQTVLPFTGVARPVGCGGGQRRQRLRHRTRRQPSVEVAGRVEQPRPCCR